MSVTTIFGPLLMTNVFSYFTGNHAPFYFPGSAFLVGALFMIASVVIAYFAFRKNMQMGMR
jgi:DHA1 family tetracycline resistance protein-like MFS transporter